jgi:hypothetical protein
LDLTGLRVEGVGYGDVAQSLRDNAHKLGKFGTRRGEFALGVWSVMDAVWLLRLRGFIWVLFFSFLFSSSLLFMGHDFLYVLHGDVMIDDDEQ